MKSKPVFFSAVIVFFVLTLAAAWGQGAAGGKIDTLFGQAQSALNAKNWQEAKGLFEQLAAADPNRWEFYQGLGTAQMNLGQFDESVRAYEKGIALAEAGFSGADGTKAKAGAGQMLTQMGNAYLKLRKNKEAVAAYGRAAAISPNPGLAYFNLCATQYNIGNMDEAEKACAKAIEADPGRADAYFIRGSAMFSRGTLGPNNKYAAPPGTAEALKKYLELSPDGKFAKDVKDMLDMIGGK
jgi:tetratricopeptide (TPR) repeat protein